MNPRFPERHPPIGSRRLAWLISSMCLSALAACGGGGGGGEPAGGTPPGGGSTPLDAGARLLASNCFQCHGTDGTGGFESIRGDDAGEVREYRNLAGEPAGRDIMTAHAQGYTDEQIALILAYLQR